MSGAAWWLKTGVRALSRVAPGSVARLAHSLYRNPNVARRFDRGVRDLLVEAQAIIDEGESFDTETSVGALRAYRFRGDGPLVLLLHAWTGDARAMAAFIKPLQAEGYDVLVPDLPAHGASAGRETDAPASGRAVKEMLESEGLRPNFFIGHSFGGGVAGVLADLGYAPDRFVCIASPSRLRSVTDDFCAAFGLSPASRRVFESLVESSHGVKIDDLDGFNFWPDKKTQILVLHAPDDAEIDFSEAERIATLPNAWLKPMPGLGHREIVYHESSVAAALAWLNGDEIILG